MTTQPPHVIRLRAPWEFVVTATGGELRRYFNAPTNLAHARVELAFAGLVPSQLRLNERELQASASGRYEITPFLLQRNQLAIVISSEKPPEEYEVRLEIG